MKSREANSVEYDEGMMRAIMEQQHGGEQHGGEQHGGEQHSGEFRQVSGKRDRGREAGERGKSKAHARTEVNVATQDESHGYRIRDLCQPARRKL